MITQLAFEPKKSSSEICALIHCTNLPSTPFSHRTLRKHTEKNTKECLLSFTAVLGINFLSYLLDLTQFLPNFESMWDDEVLLSLQLLNSTSKIAPHFILMLTSYDWFPIVSQFLGLLLKKKKKKECPSTIWPHLTLLFTSF